MSSPKPQKNESPDKAKLERRIVTVTDAELRVDDPEKPRLVGYAAKYGIQTDLGFFKEKIKSGAFDDALKSSDARAQFNHDPNLLLGRESSGTLRLESNTVGLKFEIDVPDTSAGHDVMTLVKRGDLQGCSFAFTVAEDEWKYSEEGTSERTIVKIGELYDIGPVTWPAYSDTTVAARSLEAMKTTEQREEPPVESKSPEKPPEPIPPERKKQIQEDYAAAGRIIHRMERVMSPDA